MDFKSTPPDQLDITELSRLSGFPSSALRYYEQKGLIRSCGRRGLKRMFEVEVLERLALIALGCRAGFSLDELGRLFAIGPLLDRGLLLKKADELETRIQELARMRDGLRHAAACPAPDHLQCPKFRRLLRLGQKTAGHRSSMKRRPL